MVQYHPEIDGLRAIAIVSVVIFHLFPFLLGGGFVGVDIFFVISGFLITKIIVEDIQVAQFSFIEFYVRRIIRLFPSLLVVVITILCASFIYFPADKIISLSHEIVAGLFFFSNFFYWKQFGYFSENSGFNPFLHLWSLSVEEQFYLIWPFVIWFFTKLKIRISSIALILFIFSFIFNLQVVKTDPQAAFYFPLTRMWQFIFGALTYFFGNWAEDYFKKFKLDIIGLLMIFISFAIVNSKSSYPGYLAILPTLGSGLLIYAGSKSWLNRIVLSSTWFRLIGKISYPLYLWHWPIFVFINYLWRGDVPISARIIIVQSSFILAWLTYKFIESPIRFGKSNKKKLVFSLLGSGLAIILVSISSSLLIGSIKPTISDIKLKEEQKAKIESLIKARSLETSHIDGSMFGKRPCFKSKQEQTKSMFIENGCLKPEFVSRKNILLLGDSHSASLSLGLKPYLESKNYNLLQVSTGWCEPMSNNTGDLVCKEINDEVKKAISSINPTYVIIDCAWLFASKPPYFVGNTGFYQHLLDYLSEIQLYVDKKIYVIGQIPSWNRSLPEFLIDRYLQNGVDIPSRTFEGIRIDSLDIDDVMRSLKYPDKVTYLSLRDVLCNQDGCLTKLSDNLEKDLIVWDYGHLTSSAAVYVTDKLFSPNIIENYKMPSKN